LLDRCSFFVAGAAVVSLAQNPAAIDAGSAKVEFENKQIRVLRVSLGAHQKGTVHSHPG
jgi:hypothetical protein